MDCTAAATAATFSLPCFMSVKHGRKAVCVVGWGEAPFAVEPKTGALVPHNFRCETKFLDTTFVASTHVDQGGRRIRYQFSTSVDGDGAGGVVCGEVCANATAALQSVADKLGEAFLRRFRRGTGGLLHVGVTSANIQEAIRAVHGATAKLPPASAAVVVEAAPQQQPPQPAAAEAQELDVVTASRCLLWLKSSSNLLLCEPLQPSSSKRARISSHDGDSSVIVL